MRVVAGLLRVGPFWAGDKIEQLHEAHDVQRDWAVLVYVAFLRLIRVFRIPHVVTMDVE